MICRRDRVECSAKKQGLKAENGRAEWRARERAARPHTQRGGLLLMMMLLPLMTRGTTDESTMQVCEFF